MNIVIKCYSNVPFALMNIHIKLDFFMTKTVFAIDISKKKNHEVT